ncbi:GPI inositol-deacylase isoform X1 [Syzygium oleosum]|uniref:GPI inositol-deacylase isoform X1 n=2 Tax=Syzygium oleosum TaxID=219896 RepID=UPI0024BA8A3E|nr:GPI inositol-deacylase isoform X1 [Syzygium oleosum]XP_056176362.1 GPI inositol-deacylase isoform X1 [Syzygium oleosum]XP_056176363.1 GPI inositol-deacylase isoform X1 [Syzygium oleosum]XP_056176364.1 GPI inositol-deacylase isoform X1 [Syzygium oleosum]XP_056176365.1 GPI inositol-deacylase isoform X1 [Syzygium oleosum]
MKDLRDRCRVVTLVILAILVALFGFYGLVKPVSNGCDMTYMYPTYIPISSPQNVSSGKYGLYLYHEGWKKIDFADHLKKLNGVPVLFIPGNGGSYKQVRSLGAESDRALQGGPLERTFYQEASLTPEEGGLEMDVAGLQLPSQYSRRLDWFAVDLEGEHSAMDGRILEEHAEYVVYAIHRILDQYKESRDAPSRGRAAISGSLPKSVILVGHSMGGFVARAAIVHPHLRKSAVETVLTLSSPHQSPPLALQPSLGHYFARVNEEWRKGYEVQTNQAGHQVSDHALSKVVVVSITGGINDYQVRSKLESLQGIVPSTHGFMITSTSMKNVWLSMEHQVILWCNQLVVQVSHTLLSLIDSKTGQPYDDTHKRLAIFAKMLRSGIAQSFNQMKQSQTSMQSSLFPSMGKRGSQVHMLPECPANVQWSNDGLERDLYIQTKTVTVLAMDGRRRWLDIQKLGSDGRNHFILVTNLAPCSGVRLHLWPERGKLPSNFPVDKRVQEVTSKMVHIPSGPAPRQIEPGSQTEQPPPSAVFMLGPEDMHGFRFLTISVAPRPSISGRPPPAASMAVGQFFNPEEGQKEFSPLMLFSSSYSQKDIFLREDHPIAFNLSFGISLGLLPVTLSLKTAGCGIKDSGLPVEEAGDTENSRLCKLRCFPPVALAWDVTAGLHVIPNFYTETIAVDSAPALWSSTQESDKTTILLLVDPHCSYKSSITISFTAAASRFLLLYSSQIIALCFAVIFFALMCQARAWDLNSPIPSMLRAVQSNLRMPFPALLLIVVPISVALLLSLLIDQSVPPLSFIIISTLCYLLANGFMIILLSISQLVFYVAAVVQIFVKTRWQLRERVELFCQFINLSSGFFSLKVVRFVAANSSLVIATVASTFVCLVHPALGLFILVLLHAFCCNSALCSFFTASFRSHTRGMDFSEYKKDVSDRPSHFSVDSDHKSGDSFLGDNYSSSPESARSFADTQLDFFHHRHGLLMLHLLAALMFVPSLAAWWQRVGTGQSFPWLLDSVLCICVIVHGTSNPKPDSTFFSFPSSSFLGGELKMYYIYQFAGCYSFLSGLALAPYRVFYAMAMVGFLSLVLNVLQKRSREKGEAHVKRRKHSHRH